MSISLIKTPAYGRTWQGDARMTPVSPLTSIDLLALAGPHCSLCGECEQHEAGGEFDATLCECPPGTCLLQDDVY